MDIVTVEDNQNNIVKKHQELVRSARYRLSEVGIKTIVILISQIKVSDEEFHEYTVRIEDIKDLIGATKTRNNRYYADIVTDDLMSRPFWIGNEKFNWVTYARWQEDKNIVVFEIHRKLKPYLLGLQANFLQYNITNILKLRSGYVIRLYEICKDHYMEKTRNSRSVKKVVFDLKIERMKELFEIPESYRYNDIKRHILDKSAKQFKEKTDIQIEYEEQKIGRRVDRIIITVRENNKGSNDYLSSRHAFIDHIRMNYVNADLIETVDKNTGNKVILSVAPDGKLYDKLGASYEASRSDEMWDTLFDLAQQGKLPVMNRPTLF